MNNSKQGIDSKIVQQDREITLYIQKLTNEEHDIVTRRVKSLIEAMEGAFNKDRVIKDKYIEHISQREMVKIKATKLNSNRPFLSDVMDMITSLALNHPELQKEIMQNDILNNTLRSGKRRQLREILNIFGSVQLARISNELKDNYGIFTGFKKDYIMKLDDLVFIYRVLKTLRKRFKKLIIALKYEKELLKNTNKSLSYGKQINNRIIERMVSERMRKIDTMVISLEKIKSVFDGINKIAGLETKFDRSERYRNDERNNHVHDEDDDDLEEIE